jgi:Zn-finger nucleic acid-binding protein
MYRSTPPTLMCPQCALGLRLVEGEVPLFMCTQCGGAWIDAQASMDVLQGKADPSVVQRSSKPPSPRTGPERSRPCARCSEAMLPYPFAEVMLDTCPAHGTWFDQDEIERVVKAARRPTNDASIELPSSADIWATAKFTVGMVVMPITALVNALASLSDYVPRGRRDDDYY